LIIRLPSPAPPDRGSNSIQRLKADAVPEHQRCHRLAVAEASFFSSAWPLGATNP
jgi:hypothetical protein